jgi:hypothetical protein
MFNNTADYSAAREAQILVDESNFDKIVMDPDKDVFLVIAQSGCEFCAEVEKELLKLKLLLQMSQITQVKIGIMDANATDPEHSAMKKVTYGLHYPTILLYTELDKVNPVSLGAFVGDLGPKVLNNDLLGMLLWHKMWTKEELAQLKQTVPKALLAKIQKNAAFTNSAMASQIERDGGSTKAFEKNEPRRELRLR